jgi:predicted chitinase
MTINRKKFYDTFRTQFHPRLTQQQVDGYNAILNYWEAAALTDLRWLAYILATAYHETGGTIAPVREGFCKTDEGSIQAVTRLYQQGKIRQNYARPEANGKSYFGRGLVQLTWADNYKRMGQALGMGTQLYDNPSLLLDLDISVKVLFKGMIDGLFTGQSLGDYFNASKTDWQQARKIVNGRDKAILIADYAQRFKACLA